MRVTKISLNEFLSFMNDHDSAKNNSPRIINVFSLKTQLTLIQRKIYL